MAAMEKNLEAILQKFESQSHESISEGLECLESLLKSLEPSIKHFHRSGMADEKLSLFVSLQNSFLYNLTSGLISAYHVFSKSNDRMDEGVVMKTNYLLSGMLLIHPESRTLFNRSHNMALMISFLHERTPFISEHLAGSFVSLFIHMLMKDIRNMRLFEAQSGCQILIHHLSISSSNHVSLDQKMLHFKVIEFLIFYLADETELLNLPQNRGAHIISVGDKANLFRPHFAGIDDMIKNLEELKSLRSSYSV